MMEGFYLPPHLNSHLEGKIYKSLYGVGSKKVEITYLDEHSLNDSVLIVESVHHLDNDYTDLPWKVKSVFLRTKGFGCIKLGYFSKTSSICFIFMQVSL